MNKYIKQFETHDEYDTYISGEDKLLPNVSYCEDENMVHYNSYVPFYTIVYKGDGASSTNMLLKQMNFWGEVYELDPSSITKITLDGEEVQLDDFTITDLSQSGITYIVYTYIFDDEDEHVLRIWATPNVSLIFGPHSGPLSSLCYFSSIKSVIIPDCVTRIGNYAFGFCTNLTSITIPDSVTSIGTSAFYLCTNLKSITIPDSVTSIGGGAFSGCSGLMSVTIPNSVTSIEFITFGGCSSLMRVDIPDSITHIRGNAFNGCSGLMSVVIPNSVTTIDGGAFSGCTKLTSITIPNSVTNIGKAVFSGCSSLVMIDVESGNTKYDSRDNCNAIVETATNTLITGCQNTTIPNSVTTIGEDAFERCSNLTSITIPNSVTSIGNDAFSDCSSLTSITIPNSVTTIDGNAFQSCANLVMIDVESGNTKYDSRDNCNAIIETATNTLITGCQNTTIPNTVTSIGSNAFSNCTKLTSITIPNSVTNIGNFAFDGCSILISVTVEATVPLSLGLGVFGSNHPDRKIYVPSTSVGVYKSTRGWSEYENAIEAIQ